MTPSEFRNFFPAFTADMFPDPRVAVWLAQAEAGLSESRFGQHYSLGVALFAAHYLSRFQNQTPGSVAGGGGLVSSESVDKVSVSYDTASVQIDGGGHWNETTYGRELFQLMRRAGIGVFQV